MQEENERADSGTASGAAFNVDIDRAGLLNLAAIDRLARLRAASPFRAP